MPGVPPSFAKSMPMANRPPQRRGTNFVYKYLHNPSLRLFGTLARNRRVNGSTLSRHFVLLAAVRNAQLLHARIKGAGM
jgi:hypothetical protein